MTTPDGTEPTYPAAPGPLPAPEPLSFPADPTPGPDAASAGPADQVAADPAPAYPPGYPEAGDYPPGADPGFAYPPGADPGFAYPADAYPPGAYPPGYPTPTYPPGAYPPGAYPPGYPAPTYPPGYPYAAYPPGYPQAAYSPGYPQAAYPPGYPGYIPADYSAYGQPMFLVDLNDPLVTAPGQGFRGWWQRLTRTVRAHWATLLPIMLVTYALPTALTGGGSNALDRYRLFGAESEIDSLSQANLIGGSAVVLGFVLGAYLSAVGWAAVAWVVTRGAAGQPATFGEAMGYGFRRSGRLFGWQVLTSVTVTAAMCCTPLPGVYIAFASSLVMPIAIYARSNPFGESFSMIHRNFGPALGRIATLGGFVLAGAVVGAVLEFVLVRQFPLATGYPRLATGSALSALVEVPGQLLFTVGALLVYAELAARTAPTNTPSLNASL